MDDGIKLGYSYHMKNVQLSPTGVRKYYSAYWGRAIEFSHNNSRLIKNLESARSVTLEQDIDAPIKACVMGFALLGCSPTWSCCGFDYAGQPVHKSHQIGRCYFILGNPIKALSVFSTLVTARPPMANYWECQSSSGNIDWHSDFKNHISAWDNSGSIHYSEQATQFIRYLEIFLSGLAGGMSDTATIVDTNQTYSQAFKSWQYPVKESWTFTKEDFLARAYGN